MERQEDTLRKKNMKINNFQACAMLTKFQLVVLIKK